VLADSLAIVDSIAKPLNLRKGELVKMELAAEKPHLVRRENRAVLSEKNKE
jgi:hypothetical protein